MYLYKFILSKYNYLLIKFNLQFKLLYYNLSFKKREILIKMNYINN